MSRNAYATQTNASSSSLHRLRSFALRQLSDLMSTLPSCAITRDKHKRLGFRPPQTSALFLCLTSQILDANSIRKPYMAYRSLVLPKIPGYRDNGVHLPPNSKTPCSQQRQSLYNPPTIGPNIQSPIPAKNQTVLHVADLPYANSLRELLQWFFLGDSCKGLGQTLGFRLYLNPE